MPKRVLVAFDADSFGDRAAERLVSEDPRARRMRPPDGHKGRRHKGTRRGVSFQESLQDSCQGRMSRENVESGAADYIVKPFSATELTARVGVAIRARAGTAPFALGGLAIDYGRRGATVDGRDVAITHTMYEILRILSLNAGRVVTSESLLRQALRGGRGATNIGRVRAFVKQIRAKLGEDAARLAWILTERGIG